MTIFLRSMRCLESDFTFLKAIFQGLRSVLLWGLLVLASNPAYAAPGDLDPLNVFGSSNSAQFVATSVVEPDGKIILAGRFTTVLGQTRNCIARLNADGTLDSDFNPNVNELIASLTLQTNGQILIGGNFTTVSGISRNYIARLNSNGELDTSFNPNSNGFVSNITLQPDDGILVGGNFNNLGGSTRNRIARLDPTGLLDPSFDPNANNEVSCIALQADGMILLGGTFTSIGGTTRNRIARVSPSGVPDTAFNPNANGQVDCIVEQPDGRILLAGKFRTMSGTSRDYMARVDASGLLDTTFNPRPWYFVNSLALQTDGNIHLVGSFEAVGGMSRSYIARVDAAGLLDSSFNPTATITNSQNGVTSVALQTDGRVLLGGTFNRINGTTRERFARLLNDPSIQSLSTPAADQFIWSRGGSSPEVSQVTFEKSDGNGANWTTLGPGTRIGSSSNWQLTSSNLPTSGLIRVRGRTSEGAKNSSSAIVELTARLPLAPTPTVTSISPSSGSTLGGTIVTITGTDLSEVFSVRFGDMAATTFSVINATTITATSPAQSAGAVNVVVATPTGTSTGIFTYVILPPSVTHSTANLLNTATTMTITGTGFSTTVANNRVVFTPGGTGSVTGATPTSLTVRIISGLTLGPLNAVVTTSGRTSGAAVQVATVVVPPPPTVSLSTAGLPTNATIMRISGTNFSTTPGNNSVAFTPAGTGTVTAATATLLTIGDLSGHIPGALNAVVTTNGQTSGAAAQVATVVLPGTGDADLLDPLMEGTHVEATVTQPDGKMLIAGSFTSVLGQPRNNIARLNADGTLDAGFNSNVNNTVLCVALQADGRILLGGDFYSVGGITRNRIARVNANGTLDTSFNPDANSSVYSMAVQADGGILLGGSFSRVGGIVRDGIARVDASGTLDVGFKPHANSIVSCIAVQEDGKILLGGAFTSVGGTARSRIARVDAAGTLDMGFNPGANDQVITLAVQREGKILLGGSFTSVAGTGRNRIARLETSGALDANFNPGANSSVLSLAAQADGKILLGGAFTSIGGTGRNRIARLETSGALDANFNPDANGSTSVSLQADGKILLGGSFNTVARTTRNRFARLLNDPATQTLNAADTAQLTWTRGGSTPEVSQVTFEKSTDDGTTWTPLGYGTRISGTPNWQLTGLSLPHSGQLRARGRTSSGFYNRSSGLVEQVVSFSGLLPALETWRQLHFNTTANAGDAADNFDFDQDGLVNLIEFAFGLDPKVPDGSAQLPQPSFSGGNSVFSFTPPIGVSGITYGAEWSTTLLPGSWTSIPNTGIFPQHVFSQPTAGQPKMYLRLVITAP